MMPAEVTAEPGPYRNERTPYLVGVMDATVEPGVEEVVLVSGTQIGKSTAGQNVLGYAIDNDPGPYLVVMPDEKSAEEYVRERIQPMLRSSPSLARHLSIRREDNKLSCITLDTMSIYIGWAGSPQSLATRPCRYVEFDETDKYPAFAGGEADPISLGTERTKTYLHRKRVFKRSSPTTREGAIWKAWEACGDKRFFHVPCPHCGEFQRLIWAQLKYPKLPEPDKVKRADAIKLQRLAWYECAKCKGRIEDRHKPAMLVKGHWVSEGNKSPRVGFHLNSIYSPWVTFGDMAAKWILAEGDPGATMNFRNSWLAEPDEQVQTKVRPSAVRDKIKLAPAPLIVPRWTGALFATADTQKDHFYFTIRAWGYNYRSQLVHYGQAQTFKELAMICLESVFRSEAGVEVRPQGLLIDSGGNRTNEVYEFAATDVGRIFPTKGASTSMGKPHRLNRVGNAGMMLYMLDTGFYKDMLARMIGGKLDDGSGKMIEQWMPHSETSEDYCIQMASEHKVIDRKSGKLMWIPISSGAANHFWDCEVLQCAAAEISNVAITAPATEAPAQSPQADNGGGFGPKSRW
jgi:phage terminase large subunit GpA-like protein